VLLALLAFFVAVPCLLRSTTVVPPKCAADAVEPLGGLRQDSRERVLRRGNGDVVALAELDAALAVKGAVSGGARLEGHSDAQGHAVVEKHGSEGERVGADGGEQDGGNVGVDKGAAGRERVGCRSRRRREDAPIGLHNREEVVVAVQLEVGDVGRWAAVDDELVEDLKLLGLDVRGRSLSSVLLR
jgi:hypothetical protein